ncbi:BatA and WFA domain-containing protein [Flavobacteriaceae bacterium SZ-1-7]|uniref:vWA domain-containing protein n=1 Tax=Tamlana sedimenti TaxID=3134126 RepID=UPI0031220B7D
MQFKHPELLYALFLLLIPIIVHLFQLRKFQKVPFTNVAFLKEATIQTRKSSQIKKWLVLINRLLLMATLVFAFAQPFTSKTSNLNAEKETVVYLDNSFSMQAKGSQGELLKRAVQDIIENVPEDENISIVTNDNSFKNTTIKAIKNELLQIDYSSEKISAEAALLKSNAVFDSKKGIVKNLVYISDFQENNGSLSPQLDSLTHLHLVKLAPVNANNIAIDSAFISERTATSIELKVKLINSGNPVENLPISLFNNNNLIAKTSVEIDKSAETTFSIPVNEVINGKISIDDSNLQFDNTLFFSINKPSKINVLGINGNDDSFLKRIYTLDEFNYMSTPVDQLNYNLIDSQHLIVLNELDDIPMPLATALKQFTRQGGIIVAIPSETINIESYNQLLTNYKSRFINFVETDKQVTNINYAHPLYNQGVFEKQVKNFQYPKVSSYYNFSSSDMSSALQFEDGKTFLGQIKNTFLFASALNQKNSSFKNSPLIVPTFYNIAKQSLKIPELYYEIGENNRFDVETQMQQDAVLSLIKEDINIIPKQQYFNNKVVVTTQETPSMAGTYAVSNNGESIKNVSYNYGRQESVLTYLNPSVSERITLSNSVSEIFDTLKSDSKVNALWKWFVIFALALLITEMLILKFFK